MKLSHIVILAVGLLPFLACTAQEARTVEKAVLSASQIACIFAAGSSDSAIIADLCAIDRALLPVLEQMISVREAAKKSGVSYHDPLKDAGAAK